MMKKFIIDVNLNSTSQKRMIADFFRVLQSREDLAVVIGGTKYREELGRAAPKLRRLILALKKAGEVKRLVERADSEVDAAEIQLENQTINKFSITPSECDDFHILALCALTSTQFVFTADERMGRCIGKLQQKISNRHCPRPTFIRDEPDYKTQLARNFS